MGTRHLIAVQIDGEYKIAQYGQWDGYYEGQGQTVLGFLRSADLAAFADKVRGCHWLTPDEIAAVAATPNWTKVYPHLSRDAGGDILDMVAKSESGLGLISDIAFANDGLMCEFAYVVDLDAKRLEVFKGFKTTPPPVGERFHGGEGRRGYHPVHLALSFPLDALPERLIDDTADDEDAEVA